MTVPLRAALYLRVSTARQAEHDVSIPDQKRQGEAYCQSRGIEGRFAPNARRRRRRKIGYARRSQFCSELAEREGFEPSVPSKGHNGFRDRPDRPLRHLSRARAAIAQGPAAAATPAGPRSRLTARGSPL